MKRHVVLTCLVLFLALIGSLPSLELWAESDLWLQTEEPTSPPTEAPPPTATEEPTAQPPSTSTDEPTNTPTDTPTNTPEPPTHTPTDTPTNTPEIPTNTPTDTPTNTPEPPTHTPTDTPTNSPTEISHTPTDPPTVAPTSTPTNTPTPTPTPVIHDVGITAFFVNIHGNQPGLALKAGQPRRVPVVVELASYSSHFHEGDTVSLTVTVLGVAGNCGATMVRETEQVNIMPGHFKTVIFHMNVLCANPGDIPNAIRLRVRATHLNGVDADPVDNERLHDVPVSVRR